MQNSSAWRVIAVLSVVALTLSACVTANQHRINNFNRGDGKLSIMLMPMDIELSELTAGGVREPKAEWTAKAEKHVHAAIKTIFSETNAQLADYTPSSENTEAHRTEVQLAKLHSVVGQTILLNELLVPLPTKENKFDWTLGEAVTQLRGESDANYALFVFVRDSYASEGRAAVIAIGIILGVGIRGGQQLGYASLVDLNTGEIVWFNRLARGSGDLRTAKDAMESARVLFAELPK